MLITFIKSTASNAKSMATMISLFGKMTISGTFGVIFNYTAGPGIKIAPPHRIVPQWCGFELWTELYPTEIRAKGFGFCSSMA